MAAATIALALMAAAGCSTGSTVQQETQPDSTATRETDSPWERVVVSGSVVNLRAGPGTGYAVLGQVGRGDTLDVMGVSRDWLKVYHARQSLFAWIYEPLTESLGLPE
ncbi:MAG: SH3 domain-containing protein [Candidatus Fermentibacterota bacterium]